MTKLAFLLLLLLFARNGEMNPCGGVSADPSTWSHVDMELRSWLDVRGYSAAAPALEARDGGLYVRDGHRLLPGDEIAVIPRSLILTSNDVFGTGASKIPDHVALQMWLCLQRYDPDSPWRAYLRALPSTFDLPFLWPESERDSLLREPFVSEVVAQVSMVRRTHEAFMKPLRFCTASPVGQQVCDFKTWQWAWAVAWSRALAVPAGGDSSQNSTNALIPLLDMANHQSGAAARLRWNGTTLELVANLQLQSGDELTIDYMPLHAQPTDFLRQYGFVPLEKSEASDSGTTSGSSAGASLHETGGEVCTDSRLGANAQGRQLLLEGAELADQRRSHWHRLAALIAK